MMALPYSDKIIENPEEDQYFEEDNRCRICYDTARPLISVCSCAGSMTFVHEDCILDWITKKIESAERVEIPSCEICHEKYSARMKVGKKKVCTKMLWSKMRSLPLQEKAMSAAHCISFVFAIVNVMLFFVSLFSGNLLSESFSKILQNTFMLVVSPLYVLCICRDHALKRKKLVDESIVQIVEVTLQPKVALTC